MNVKKLDKNATTRTKIITSAIDLFSSKGIEAVTFSEIAKKCKVSQPNIYNHFSDKMDLIKHCALYAAEQGRQYIDQQAHENLSAPERLQNYLRSNLVWFHRQRAMGQAVLAIYFFAGSNKEFLEFYNQLVSSGTDRIQTILLQGQRESAWSFGDLEQRARAIHNMIVGEVYKVRYMQKMKDVELHSENFWQTIQILL